MNSAEQFNIGEAASRSASTLRLVSGQVRPMLDAMKGINAA